METNIALITGGTKGIGKAIAKRLLKDNYDVLLTYGHDKQSAEAVQSELHDWFPSNKIYILQADITNLGSVEVIIDYLVRNKLCINAVVLNAGITDRTDFLEIELDEWRRIFDANVHFPVFLLQKLYPLLPEGSSVVFTGSLMGIQPHSTSLVYGVTKATVHALVKNLVKFLAPKGIRVNAVAPGYTETEWHKTKSAEKRNNINSKIALGRFCEPDEQAEVYQMLISNRYINGEIVVVDGGYSYK